MKYTCGKRILAIVLSICLILAMIPVHFGVEAEAVSGISSLTCAGFISNTEHRTYIDTMMKHYLNTNSKLTTALDNGKNVIFMFEGGSDNYPSNTYTNTGDQRTQAVCIVVQKDSSGNAKIVFYSENCSSLPDNPDNCTGAAYSGATTIADGIYSVKTWNHTGPYGALQTSASQGYYTPPGNQNGYFNGASGINIHTRTSASSNGGWSLGCQVIGYGNSSSNEFNAFMKTVAGINYNVWVTYKSALYTLSGSDLYKDVGYYVLDRQLALVNSSGTRYGSGSLIAMYNSTALTNLTAWSTAERAKADFGYLSQCTPYASHCQIKVTLDGAPINSQPRSVSTADKSETLETASVGATYTATGLYKNSFGNYWYQVTTASGEKGYIYAGECSYVKQLTSDITLSGASYPNGHVAGKSFVVNGTIKSSYNQLSTVAVYAHGGFGTSGTKLIGSSAAVNGNSYTLASSTIDANTVFGDLTAGKYTYAIYASYVNYYATDATTLNSNTGTITLMDEYFVVVPSSVEQSSCSHSNTTTTIKASTCTETGTTVTSCSVCGLVSEITTAAKGHSYGSWTTVNATCTADGSKTRICSACGDDEVQTIVATGHKYNLKIQPATCETYAVYEYTCGTCGDYYKQSADEMASQWLETVPGGMSSIQFNTKTQYRYADCTSTSWEEYNHGTVTYVNSWATGFDTTSSVYTQYNKKSSKVSADEGDTTKIVVNHDKKVGYLYYHWCSTTVTSSWAYETDVYDTFHVYYDTTDPSNYSCDTSDYSYKTSHSSCSNTSWWFPVEVYEQDYTFYQKVNDGKEWTEWSAWSDTAYTAVENTRKVESRTVYQLKEAKLGSHSYSSATCTQPQTCTVCGVTNGSSAGHKYQSVVTLPTCTSGGYTTYTCTGCGHRYTGNAVASTGHTWSDGTCASCGIVCEHTYTNGTCTVCGDTVANDSKDIKWQITRGTNASSASTNLRLVSWVSDVDDFESVSFNVTINGRTVPLVCTTAYTAIKASGLSISNPAGVFGEESANYFVTYTINGIPAALFDSDIVVTVTWTDMEGNSITSESESIVISSDWT